MINGGVHCATVCYGKQCVMVKFGISCSFTKIKTIFFLNYRIGLKYISVIEEWTEQLEIDDCRYKLDFLVIEW